VDARRIIDVIAPTLPLARLRRRQTLAARSTARARLPSFDRRSLGRDRRASALTTSVDV